MTELMLHASASYDFVVVDCGPALLVPDALALMTQVAGVLVVTHLGGTMRVRDGRMQVEIPSAPACRRPPRTSSGARTSRSWECPG